MGNMSEMDGEAISLWGASEVSGESGVKELEAAVVRLTERLDRLEEHQTPPVSLSIHPCKDENGRY
jgi:hypothetical protein